MVFPSYKSTNKPAEKAQLDGELFLQNIHEAINQLIESADECFAPSQYFLGKLLYKGEAMTQDLERTIDYLEKAANQKIYTLPISPESCDSPKTRSRISGKYP